MTIDQKRGLGIGAELLGLDELLTNTNECPLDSDDYLKTDTDGSVRYVPYYKLKPGQAQPRKSMNDEGLVELARSIRQHGIIQPIVVQASASVDGGYTIVAGERRWRAAKLANLQQVPVIIRNFTDQQAVAVALIENIQREDLNVVDQARGLQRLLAEFNLTHQEVASLIGKSRAAVSNTLRLLMLEEALLDHLIAARLDMGHARCLLSLPESKRCEVADRIINQQLSVRSAERLVKAILEEEQQDTPIQSEDKQRKEKWHTWTEVLHKKLAMPVRIRSGRGKRVNIELCCKNDGELEKLIAVLQDIGTNIK